MLKILCYHNSYTLFPAACLLAFTAVDHFLLNFLAIALCLKENPDCDLPRATCNEIKKGKYKCSCKPGYTGDGKWCTGNYSASF